MTQENLQEKFDRMARWLQSSTDTIIDVGNTHEDRASFEVYEKDGSPICRLDVYTMVEKFGWSGAGKRCVLEVKRHQTYNEQDSYQELEENARLKMMLKEERETNKKRLNELIVQQTEIARHRKLLRKLAACKETSAIPDDIWREVQEGYGP